MTDLVDGADGVLAKHLRQFSALINSKPALLSILYDAGLMPEQITTVRDAILMEAVCLAYKAGFTDAMADRIEEMERELDMLKGEEMTDGFFWTVIRAATLALVTFFVLALLDPDQAALPGQFASGCFAGYLCRAFGETK